MIPRPYLAVAIACLISPAAAAAQDCTTADSPARVMKAAMPQIPVMAQQQGISGRVEVIVSMDAQSHVVSAKIRSSPSTILNYSALTAARNSTYQTAIAHCAPIAADYIFTVSYNQR